MSHHNEETSDPVGALLRGAEAPPPPVPPGLADRIRVRARRRRRRRGGLALAVLVGGLVSVTVAVLKPRADLTQPVAAGVGGPAEASTPSAPGPLAGRAVASAHARELADASAGVDARLAAARRLAALERRHKAARRLRAQNGPLALAVPVADRYRDQAALTLVGQADRLRSRANRPADALATYRRAAELFPDTVWAAIARERIGDLEREMKT